MILKKTLLAGLALLMCACLMAQELPRLNKTRDGRTQLLVDGKPFIALSGELHNSTTGSVEYMADVWKRMAALHMNTVIAPVTWELLEPVEGQFDYTIIDNMISGARKENLKLVVLWFGSWKNGESTYTPAWVKKDTKRFPRTKLKGGSETITLSTLGTETAKADANAFAHLMRHIKEVDRDHTVIMMQIENEIGTVNMRATFQGLPNDAMRDFNELANKAFNGQVPQQLISYLKANKKTLHPAILEAWNANGNKEKGTWEEVFGVGKLVNGDDWHTSYNYLTEEIFNAWNYATFVEQVTKAGKAELALPMYVNAWMKAPAQTQPGIYPSGGPEAHLIDIWRAGAPSIDFIAPDIYAVQIFDTILEDYTLSGNPLFIPETTSNIDGASRAFYTIGKYGALCYAPFGIDGGGLTDSPNYNPWFYGEAYQMLEALMPYLTEYVGTDKCSGLYLTTGRDTDSVEMGGYQITMRRFSTEAAEAMFGAGTNSGTTVNMETSGALIIQVGEGDFIVAGGLGGASISFAKGSKSKAQAAAFLSVDELRFDANGKLYAHRINGDEVAYAGVGGSIPVGKVGAFRVKMYEY